MKEKGTVYVVGCDEETHRFARAIAWKVGGVMSVTPHATAPERIANAPQPLAAVAVLETGATKAEILEIQAAAKKAGTTAVRVAPGMTPEDVAARLEGMLARGHLRVLPLATRAIVVRLS